MKIVQESGVGEIEIEDEGMRVSVRRADEGAPTSVLAPSTDRRAGADRARGDRRYATAACGSSRRWSASSTARRNPGAPAFVDVGDTVVPDQVLCIIEAMKLFNELKAEVSGVVAAIHAENAQPVEYGQLLFEIEPVLAPPAV